ncbi:MAG: 3-dehydroquinate synthase [candidate division WOR-3 bacterium]
MVENIVLIGFMGTGKDTIGRVLAEKLNMGFLSTDQMIEFSEQRSIKEIFAHKGETHFRKIEKRVINQIAALKNCIIATGGGVVLDPENRRRLKKMGIVVHLSTNLDVLEKRIASSGNRPLIKKVSDIKKLYQERQGMYDFADIRIETTDKEPEVVVQEIIDKLNLKKLLLPFKAKRIYVEARSRNYPVLIGFDLLNHISLSGRQVLIITNPLVGTLYLNELLSHLIAKGNQVEYLIIPDGERYKNLQTVRFIYNRLFALNFTRQDFIISLGGGVINDLAGFVASTFKRGCHLIHIPTTLLAQIDAAIGGKTGINSSYGKNMLGTFYQPDLVLCDIKKLLTLPQQEFLNGIAEAIKYGVVCSFDLFQILQNEIASIKKRDPQVLFEIVKRCVEIKAAIVKKDETEEKDLRLILNFGHTIGHIVEVLTNYKRYSHGAAVAMGMVEEMRMLSRNRKDQARVVNLLKSYNLPSSLPAGLKNNIKDFILQDKKVIGGCIKIPVLIRIGQVMVKEVSCKRFC